MRNAWELRRWLWREVMGEELPRRRAGKRNGRGPARNWKYKRWIRALPSAVSGSTPCEACHTGPHAIGQKSSDYTCIPLTSEEHRELHRIGRKDFEQRHDLAIGALVRRLNYIWFNQWKLGVGE